MLEDVIDIDSIKTDNKYKKYKKMLIPIISHGKLKYKMPNIDQVSDYFFQELGSLPQSLRSVVNKTDFPVKKGQDLKSLIKIVQINHK